MEGFSGPLSLQQRILEDSNFDILLQTVQDAWNGQYNVESFRKVLRSFHAVLLNPVERRPDKKSEDVVRSKKVEIHKLHPIIELKDPAVNDILQFSHAVNLNEIECVKLFFAADELVAQRQGLSQSQRSQAVVTQAYNLYFTRRHNLLVALLDLILMYKRPDGEFPDDMVGVVNGIVSELLRDGLVNNLILLLQDLHKRKYLAPTIQKEHAQEIWHVAQSLLFIMENYVINAAEAVALLQLLKSCSDELMGGSKGDAALTFISYVLFCTLVKSLDTKITSSFAGFMDEEEPPVARGGESKASLQEFIRDINVEETKEWKHSVFRAGFMLTWALFLRQASRPPHAIDDSIARRLCQEALNPQAAFFTNVHQQFLLSPRFQQEPRNDTLSEVLGKFFDQCVRFHRKELIELRTRETQQMWQSLQKDSKTVIDASKSSYGSFLSILAQICKLSPICIELLLENPGFEDFLDSNDGGYSGISTESPLLTYYVDLLEALSTHVRGQRKVYDMLKHSQSFNWDMIFQFCKQLLHNFLPQQSRPAVAMGGPWRGAIGMPAPAQAPAAADRSKVLQPRQETMLSCTLRLIKAVHRAIATTQYRVLDIMFGLLGCHFPPSLKALVLQTIAAFANGDREMALDVWQRLEVAQILPTIPKQRRPTPYERRDEGGVRRAEVPVDVKRAAPISGGILYDLEEVEQGLKQYPLTCAFTQLILTLLYSAPIPAYLGGEYRPPGIQPYVEFLLEHVFLKILHPARQFTKVEERWRLAELSMAVLSKLLEDLDPEQETTAVAEAPEAPAAVSLTLPSTPAIKATGPGLYLMQQLLEREAVSSQVFGLIRQAYAVQEEEEAAAAAVEATLLFSVKLLHQAFEKEVVTIPRLRLARPTARPQHLSVLLRGDPDVVTILMKLVGHVQTYTQTLAQRLTRVRIDQMPEGEIDTSELAFAAASIIFHSTQAEAPNQIPIVSILEKKRESENVIFAWASQLKHAEPSQIPSQPAGSEEAPAEEDDTDERNRARLVILELLLLSLSKGRDNNLAHLLLGFSNREIEQQDLNGGDPRRRQCLDALINLVLKPRFPVLYPSLAESCYHLFYALCANPATSRRFISFIQNRFDLFFYNLLESIPSKIPFYKVPCFLRQRAWLMKAIGLELYVTASPQRGDSWEDYIINCLKRLGFFQQGYEEKRGFQEAEVEQRSLQLLELLDALRVNIPTHIEAMPTTIGGISTRTCLVSDPSRPGSAQYNIKRLYLLASQALDAKEARALATAAIRFNRINNQLGAAKEAFEGWRQTVEVVLYRKCFTPQQDPDRYEVVLFELLSATLSKLTSDHGIWQCLGEGLSSVALTLMTKIREQIAFTANRIATQSHSVLEMMINGISNNRQHTTRANLYAVFLNYIQYTHELNTQYIASQPVLRLGAREPGDEMEEDQKELEARTLDTLERTGGTLFRVACEDAMDGPPRLRSMALVFLTTLFSDDPRQYWLTQLRKTGVFSHFLNDLKQRDAVLRRAVVSPQMQYYEHILNYESLLTFLIRVAQTREGARLLVECDAIKTFSSLRCLSQRPAGIIGMDISSGGGSESIGVRNAPSPTERHLQLLGPVLQLLLALTTSLPTHMALHLELVEFISAQGEVIVSTLKDLPLLPIAAGHAEVDIPPSPAELLSLSVLNQTTALFASLYGGPLFHAGTASALRARELIERKYEPLLLLLLPKYSNPHRSVQLRHLVEKADLHSSFLSRPLVDSKDASVPRGLDSAMTITRPRSSTSSTIDGKIDRGSEVLPGESSSSSSPVQTPEMEIGEITKNILIVCRLKLFNHRILIPTSERISERKILERPPPLLFAPRLRETRVDAVLDDSYGDLVVLIRILRHSLDRIQTSILRSQAVARELEEGSDAPRYADGDDAPYGPIRRGAKLLQNDLLNLARRIQQSIFIVEHTLYVLFQQTRLFLSDQGLTTKPREMERFQEECQLIFPDLLKQVRHVTNAFEGLPPSLPGSSTLRQRPFLETYIQQFQKLLAQQS